MLETKKKFQLVERVLCALYAYLGFFHQGHTELANLEPSMRDLQVCAPHYKWTPHRPVHIL